MLEEQSDQGVHCLPVCLHHSDSMLYGISISVKVLDNSNFLGVRILRSFTVQMRYLMFLSHCNKPQLHNSPDTPTPLTSTHHYGDSL